MLAQILLHLGVFLAYTIAASFAAFLLPAALAIPAVLLLLWVAVRFYAMRPRAAGAQARAELLRLRPLRGPALGWTLAAVPVLLVVSWTLGDLYTTLVPVPERVLNPFGPLMLDPTRRLVLAVVAIAAAPIVEEFFFRGLIQHRLERAWGAPAGITVAALLFALVHLDTLPWVVPLHMFLGAVFGWAVYATRSIWAGVLLHAANNAAAFTGLDAVRDDRRPTVWEAGAGAEWWLSMAALVAALAVGVWVAGRLRRAGRG